MKVLLKEDIENVGYAGEVHTVADGYGRNFLVPKGLAVVATPNTVKQAEVWRRKAENRRAQIKAQFQSLATKIQDVTLNFTAKAGENGKLYGSVTVAQVAEKLNHQLGTEIDRRKVESEPLRQLGEHKVTVHLSGDFQPQFTVVIHPEEEAVAEPA